MADTESRAARRATLTSDYQRDWPAYFDAVRDKPARETCVRALTLFERESAAGRERIAIDLACGEGRDTREMLTRTAVRWRVIAVDSSREGLSRLVASVDPSRRGRVTTHECAMEDVPVVLAGVRAVDLVNASFALAFCDPAVFPALWAWIVDALVPGGRFAGQFFGDRDEWTSVRPASHRSHEQVLGLLTPFDIEWLDEVEKEGDDAMGGVKHHHVFHVVARKRA